jgi:hypothetical protein
LSSHRHSHPPSASLRAAAGHAPLAHPATKAPHPPSGSGGSNIAAATLHQITGMLGGLAGLVGRGASDLISLPKNMAQDVASSMFAGVTAWVGNGAVYLLGGLGRVMSSTTTPTIGTAYFGRELGVMAVAGAAVAVPLLLLTAIQAVVQQDAGILLRAVLVRVPLALVFTGVAMQLVTLGLSATDALCGAMLQAARVPAGQLFTGLARALGGMVGNSGPTPLFVGFALACAIAFAAFVLWLELALRAAAIEAAALFLPLALAGVIWPATSHWARRLGETLAALVLSKLVIVSILALAAGELIASGGGGVAAVVSGIALLLLALLAPYALFRLVPMIEAGAVGHLQGLAGARATHLASSVGGALSGGGGSSGGGRDGGKSGMASLKERTASQSAPGEDEVAAQAGLNAPPGRTWEETFGGGGGASGGSWPPRVAGGGAGAAGQGSGGPDPGGNLGGAGAGPGIGGAGAGGAAAAGGVATAGAATAAAGATRAAAATAAGAVNGAAPSDAGGSAPSARGGSSSAATGGPAGARPASWPPRAGPQSPASDGHIEGDLDGGT